MEHIHIIHGYDANSSNHWFSWLKLKLAELNIPATLHDLPNPQDPDVEAWVEYLNTHIHLAEDTYLVGHSLGTLTILQYLSRKQTQVQIGGILLVAGFKDKLPTLPKLDAFSKDPINDQKIISSTKQRTVIMSMNDQVIPQALPQQLSKDIEARLIEVSDGGHFLGREGFSEFPLVYEELLKMISDNQNGV